LAAAAVLSARRFAAVSSARSLAAAETCRVKEKLVQELIRRDNKMYLGRSSSLFREELGSRDL
jgi:hypothetical protein